MEYRQHLGVYGVINNDNKILCINKKRGPYKNRYDLPGGSQKDGEGFKESLYREIKEETGYDVKEVDFSRAYDFFVNPNEFEGFVHHIAILFNVKIGDNNTGVQILENEENDSCGIKWIDINEINIDNSSPLLLKVKDEFLNLKNIFETKIYNNWKVL